LAKTKTRAPCGFANSWQIFLDFAKVWQNPEPTICGRGRHFANAWQKSRVFAKHWQIAFCFLLTAIPAAAGERCLTVFVTTDIHGSLARTGDLYATHNEGSLLAVATRLREEAANAPGAVLFVDCGDLFQGTKESQDTGGLAVAEVLNALGLDAFVPGNHDFDFGLPALDRFCEAMHATPLAANLRFPADAGAGLARLRPFEIVERGGLRIALVGLTTPNLLNWFPERFLPGVEVFRSLRALEHVMPRVNAERPDVRILLVHQGLLHGADDAANEVFAVCDAFREFDFVFGGHLHWVEPGREIASTPYAQAGSGARGFLRADLALGEDGTVLRRSIRYIAVDSPPAPEDPALRARLAPVLETAWEELRAPLATTTARIAPSESLGGESAMQRLLARAFREATGADVVLHGILSLHAFEPGPIALSDVWKAIPFENDIFVARLTKREILSALEAASAYAGSKRQFAAFGLTYTLDPDAPAGQRIHDVRLAATGKRLSGLKRYRVALNGYHLAGGGGRFAELARDAQAPRARLERVGSARDLLADYLKRHPVVSPDPVRDVTVRRGAAP